MPGRILGSLIGATFGLVYVSVNSGSLPSIATWVVRGLGVADFLALVVLAVRATRHAEPATGVSTRGSPFGAGYWTVVLVEAVALIVGTRLLSGPLDRPDAGVAWVSIVVGVHFFALAVVFRLPFFHLLGAAITVCGVVGLLLALLGSSTADVDVVAGLLPGALLLAAAWWGVRTGFRVRLRAGDLSS